MSDHSVDLQDVSTCNFLELGAAALLVGDMEAKMKGQPWKYFGTADMPFIDQLLQPSSVTTITNSSSGCTHLRAITVSKCSKAGPHQIWEDSPVSTFRPRALAVLTISRHFRCLRDAISGQIEATRKRLGEQDTSSNVQGAIPRLRYVDHQVRQQRALQNLGVTRHSWRPHSFVIGRS